MAVDLVLVFSSGVTVPRPVPRHGDVPVQDVVMPWLPGPWLDTKASSVYFRDHRPGSLVLRLHPDNVSCPLIAAATWVHYVSNRVTHTLDVTATAHVTDLSRMCDDLHWAMDVSEAFLGFGPTYPAPYHYPFFTMQPHEYGYAGPGGDEAVHWLLTNHGPALVTYVRTFPIPMVPMVITST